MAARETFQKKITSPELINSINPKNKKLMDRFLRSLATRRSAGTIKMYRCNLNIFFCWNKLYNDDKFFIKVRKINLMDFFDFGVQELQWKSARYAQVHSALSSFSSWIQNYLDDDYPEFKNLMPKIEKLPKEFAREKSVFTEEELNKLMKYLGKNKRIQEQCLLSLAMASGARVSELVRFTTKMIDEDNTAFEGLFLETTEDIQCKGRGTHGKMMRRYIIKKIFLPYYKKWLPLREEIMKKNGTEHDYIFINTRGEPATVSTINYWKRDWDDVLGKHLYYHSLRHYWTTYCLKAGLEQELVQELQQWSDSSLVQLYNDSTMKDRNWKGLDKLRKTLEEK